MSTPTRSNAPAEAVPADGHATATVATATPAALRGVHERIEAALRGSLEPMSETMRLVSGYQLGLWDAEGVATSAGTGKAIRPALALLSARAAGGSAEAGVPAAIAVELVHNFSLLHDDIMDGDTERRHRPTAWTIFGTSPAILSGDALLTAAVDTLVAVDSPASVRAVRSLTDATQRLITGQTADLSFEERDDVTLDECLRMASDKTAALFRCAASIGAVACGGSESLCASLGDYGEELGILFQLVDDLLGIWGTPEATGKPVLSDLRARKKSLPVAAALSAGGPEARKLADLYATPGQLTEEQLREAADLVERAGGKSWVEAEALRRNAAAAACLARADMPSEVRTSLVEIAQYIVERDR